MENRLRAIQDAEVQLLLQAEFYTKPLAARLMHLELEVHEEGKELLTEDLQGIITRDAGVHAAHLIAALKL
eukprot:452279-Pleurochrysis_carterae.AAC.1